MGDSDDEAANDLNEKGWVKVEGYHPEKLKVFTPDKEIKIHPNDKAILEIQKVTLDNGTVLTEQKEDMRVWCCDDDPEIKGLSEGIKGRKLGEFLQIKCSPSWGYSDDKRRILGINEDAVVVFWVWIKEVDPYLNHEPKCCTIL
mmetsp:Transcript_15090/g.23635  ORF Transcript_15090/g.23635 Transcript_15090/m.23635 type:complete len:144 (-) Transcript_15090:227-658(-)|eukprot:CAMPEP_0197033368 /NCGR_PEP_ID=MMETSP1384-20130603/11798_1 /TAXON_ID=29189 /ORGANISM="Ammonia sp." /LENGTH=143 /DNA_ID=CAMNT_0042463169 /DNA_START=105 /DNA_END=536 /DNA_ORIENTATION=+